MSTLSEMKTQTIAFVVFRVKTADSLKGKAFAISAIPLGIVKNYHQQK